MNKSDKCRNLIEKFWVIHDKSLYTYINFIKYEFEQDKNYDKYNKCKDKLRKNEKLMKQIINILIKNNCDEFCNTKGIVKVYKLFLDQNQNYYSTKKRK